jgi:hypothetical protein
MRQANKSRKVKYLKECSSFPETGEFKYKRMLFVELVWLCAHHLGWLQRFHAGSLVIFLRVSLSQTS